MSSTSWSWVQPSPGDSSPGPDAAFLAVRAVPDRNPVAPPQLPGDRPVVHVVDPVEIPGRQLRRVDPGAALPDGVPGGLGQRRDLDEPLQGQPWFDHVVGAGTVSDGVQVRNPLGDDPALPAQFLLDRGPRLEPVHPVENRSGVGDPCVLGHDRRHRQAVPAADLEVVGVVRRGHLDRAGAERRVDVVVGHHRDLPVQDRQQHGAADQVGVALVVRVHGHRHVAEQGLHPGGGDHHGVVTVAVTDGHQLARVLGVLHLDVATARSDTRDTS